MTRKVDELGRIILPAEYRKALKIHEKDELEIDLKAGEIIIRKPTYGCHFCDATADLVRIGDEHICRSCLERLYREKEDETLSFERTD